MQNKNTAANRIVLVNWLAISKDFLEQSEEVNPKGITLLFHQKQHRKIGYQKQLVFCQTSANPKGKEAQRIYRKARQYEAYIRQYCAHEIELVFADLPDMNDLDAISDCVRNRLEQEPNSTEIHFFMSSGTVVMQIGSLVAATQLSATFRQVNYWAVPPSEGQKEATPSSYEPVLFKPSFYGSLVTVGKPATGKAHQTETLSRLYQEATEMAKFSITVLIKGESGTGKELLAKHLHNASGRKGNFQAINCGAFHESLIESELFGVVKGAFTDARQDRDGLLKAAQGGTVFLDEIGSSSLALQQRLLRVLENQEYRPVGSDKTERADVRIIAADNRDLFQMVKEGKFRLDLYYRLTDGGTLQLNAFHEYPEDERKALVLHLLKDVAQNDFQLPQVPALSNEAIQYLCRRKFLGNFRELRGLLKRLCFWSLTKGQHQEIPLSEAQRRVSDYEPAEFVGQPTLDLTTTMRSLMQLHRQHWQAILQKLHEAARRYYQEEAQLPPEQVNEILGQAVSSEQRLRQLLEENIAEGLKWKDWEDYNMQMFYEMLREKFPKATQKEIAAQMGVGESTLRTKNWRKR
jgi:DNA-binding NtrC family response regulator